MPTDRYQQLTNSPPVKFISKRLGLPQPVPLRRYEPGQPLLDGPALVGAAPGGRLEKAIAKVLKATGSELQKLDSEDATYGALVYDATGIASTEDLTEIYEFFHPTIRKV